MMYYGETYIYVDVVPFEDINTNYMEKIELQCILFPSFDDHGNVNTINFFKCHIFFI